MTHGDKAKAKTVKTGQASGKKSSGKAATGREEKGGKTAAAGSAKARPAAGEKGGKAATNGKTRPGVAATGAEAGEFSNPLLASAFKRAIKKYPNAFRKLTE